MARGGNFREEVEAHLLHGFVFATPTAFLMGRPVPRGAEIRDVWQTWPAEKCDAWFAWIGVGAIGPLLALMPYELPWVGWVRQGRGWEEVHWMCTRALRRRVSGPRKGTPIF